MVELFCVGCNKEIKEKSVPAAHKRITVDGAINFSKELIFIYDWGWKCPSCGKFNCDAGFQTCDETVTKKEIKKLVTEIKSLPYADAIQRIY